MRTNLPRAIRALRIRRGWTQADLAARAGVSRELISRLERDQLSGVTLRGLEQVAGALDATLVVDLRWRGADLDRLIDRAHAAIQDAVATRLQRAGWDVRAEVAFNHYGDRGSCDLLAWHPTTATLLVVEVKSRFGNLQDTLRQLDVKTRLGTTLAVNAGFGRPRSVVRALVVGESHASRTVVGRHAALFAMFDLRGRDALRWVRVPGTGKGLLWFESLPDSHDGVISSAMRVRRRRKRP